MTKADQRRISAYNKGKRDRLDLAGVVVIETKEDLAKYKRMFVPAKSHEYRGAWSKGWNDQSAKMRPGFWQRVNIGLSRFWSELRGHYVSKHI